MGRRLCAGNPGGGLRRRADGRRRNGAHHQRLSAGSGPDVVARLVADKLSAQWRQPVVVDPRPGGAGVVAINAMKNAPPTGNDLVVVDVGHLSINPLVLRKLAYDPQSELTPVALLYKTAFFVVVGAQSPFHSLAELMAAARRRPGMTYGSNAVGGPLHLARPGPRPPWVPK